MKLFTPVAMIALSACLTLTPTAPAVAFDFKMPSIPTTSSPETQELEQQQASLVGDMAKSLLNINQSQSLMAQALGLNSEVSQINAVAGLLGGGQSTSKDSLSSAITQTLGFQGILDSTMGSTSSLSGTGKAAFSDSIASYSGGLSDILEVAQQIKAISSATTSLSNPAALLKLETLIYLVNAAPSLTSSLTSSASTISQFGTASGVDVSSLASFI